MSLLHDFRWSFFFTAIALFLAYQWAGVPGMLTALILIILEMSISFDNAVVNARILKDMSTVWQQRFLTWGMVIAVFGMRVVLPLSIVAIVSGLGFFEVTNMALNDQEQYAKHIEDSSYIISSFGGMFLLMVFLSFMFDKEKDVHWIGFLERTFSKIGKLDSFTVAFALTLLMITAYNVPQKEQFSVVISGLIGLVLFILLNSLSSYMESIKETATTVKKSIVSAGFISFMYLEVLDASFSLDGVIGAFAITKDVVIITLGLGIGALFVRSMTVSLVRRGTLNSFIYLEHGAHYAIGSLAVIMFLHMFMHVTSLITGTIGVIFIGAGIYSSIRHKKLLEKGSN